MTDCVFCNYAGPSEILSPDDWDEVYVIEPIEPVTPGHVLVIPKEHVRDALEDPTVTETTMWYAAEYARQRGAHVNLITSAGAWATQTIMHLHIHVVPRREGDGLLLPWSAGAIGPTVPEYCLGPPYCSCGRKAGRPHSGPV